LFHVSHLFFGEDFGEFGVDFFLEVGELLLLVGSEVEGILEHGREDLARRAAAAWAPARTGATTWTTGATATWACAGSTTVIQWSTGASAIGAAWSSTSSTSPARGDFGFECGGEGGEFFFGDGAVFVGIGLIEEAHQARVGDFFFGQLAVFVFIEGQHLGDDGRFPGRGRGLGGGGGGEDRQADGGGGEGDRVAHGSYLSFSDIGLVLMIAVRIGGGFTEDDVEFGSKFAGLGIFNGCKIG
jgi:hypothetical protein